MSQTHEAPAVEPEEPERLSGPNVRKLLKQPLLEGETLRRNPGRSFSSIQLVRVGRGYSPMIRSFEIRHPEVSAGLRTNAEIAAKVDAYLIERAASHAHFAEMKRQDQEKENARQAKRAALAAEIGAPFPGGLIVVLVPGTELRFEPNREGTGWVIDLLDFASRKSAMTTAELQTLLSKLVTPVIP